MEGAGELGHTWFLIKSELTGVSDWWACPRCRSVASIYKMIEPDPFYIADWLKDLKTGEMTPMTCEETIAWRIQVD